MGGFGFRNTGRGALQVAQKSIAKVIDPTMDRDVLLPLRQRVLEETELHYNAMTIGVFQLLAAKRDQIATARTYVELLRDYWLARNEVQRMLAGGGVR